MRFRDHLESAARVSPLGGRLAGASIQAVRSFAGIPGFALDWIRYRRLGGAERLRLRDVDPRLSDSSSTSPYDSHYLQQAIWAAERIFAGDPPGHVDVGSQLMFSGMLSARLPVTFVDLRPLELRIAQLRPIAGDVLDLPFPDRSIISLSSLHVVEHIGLGRYGDALNPSGTRLALAELTRVLAPAGNLFISLPVGRPRVCFNAHRVHDPREIVGLMGDIELVEFSAVDDSGRLYVDASLADAATLRYGCGLFWFRRGT